MKELSDKFSAIEKGGVILEEKKFRLSVTGAVVILSLCILYAGSNISSAIRDVKLIEQSNETYGYELTRMNELLEELIVTIKENQ
jgi:hypothetical protein